MKISIIGSGAFGSALAFAALKSNTDVLVIGEKNDTFSDYLKSEDRIKKSIVLEDAISFSDKILFAVPAQCVRNVAQKINNPNCSYIMASKGIELSSGLFMHEVISAVIPGAKVASIGGPNLASEIVAGDKFGITIACRDNIFGSEISNMFNYANTEVIDDILGLSALSSIKNVMAIGCGFIRQITSSYNTISTFLTMCIRESIDFTLGSGGKIETIFNFAGIGDFILTCAYTESRNVRFGISFGNSVFNELTEGVLSIDALLKRNNDMHIVAMIKEVVNNNITIYDFFNTFFDNNTR